MFVRTLPVLLACLLLVSAAQAELQFKTTAHELKATAQDRELRAVYPFTNTGTTPVWLLNLTTSCGCTAATSDKSEYQPGETGQISVIYTIGLSEGSHTHTITFQTNETGTPTYTLKITADIPTSRKQFTLTPPPVSPRELSWLRQPYTTKTITVDLRQHPGFEFTATCNHPQFQLKIETPRPGYACIEVTPAPGKDAARAELTLLFTAPDTAPLQEKIPLILFARP